MSITSRQFYNEDDSTYSPIFFFFFFSLCVQGRSIQSERASEQERERGLFSGCLSPIRKKYIIVIIVLPKKPVRELNGIDFFFIFIIILTFEENIRVSSDHRQHGRIGRYFQVIVNDKINYQEELKWCLLTITFCLLLRRNYLLTTECVLTVLCKRKVTGNLLWQIEIIFINNNFLFIAEKELLVNYWMCVDGALQKKSNW